ncbi:MAG: two-component regulator propeller domain-containing protein [Bacteroidota bacterium]
MPLRAYLILLAGCLSVLPVVAQPLTTRSYTRADGLASDYVFAVFQDREGFMWFGTDSGAVRFDGHQWTTFTTSDGLGANLVYDIVQDANGRIWVGTFEGGAAWFDGTRFHHVTDSPYTVSRLGTDAYGRVYFAQGGSIYVWEDGTTTQRVQGIPSGLHGNSFVPHPDGHILHPEPAGLTWLAPTADTVQVYRQPWPAGITFGPVNSIALVHHEADRWWFVYQSDEYMSAVDERAAIIYDAHISPSSLTLDSLTVARGGALTVAAVRSGHDLIIGSRNRLMRYDTRYPAQAAAIPTMDTYVRDVIVDYEGQIWMGLHGGGVQRVVGEHLRQVLPDMAPVSRVRLHASGEISAVSFEVLASGSRDWQTRRSRPQGNLFVAPTQNSTGMWAWAAGSRLFYDDHIWLDKDEPNMGHSSAIFSDLRFDQTDTLWASTYGDGVMRFTEGTLVDTLGTDDGLPTNMIERLVRTDDRMWMLTRSHGAFSYGQGDWMYVTTADGLPSDAVFSLTETADGAIWIGTDRGVARWDGKQMRVFDAEGRLRNERIVGLFPVNAANADAGVWVVTTRLLYHATADSLTSYGSFPLLPDAEAMIHDGAYDEATQTLHLATSSGIVQADLAQLDPCAVSPRVALYQLEAGGTTYPLRQDTTLALPYTQNDVTVSFAALTFRAPEAAQIQYRWYNTDETAWSAPSQNRTVTLLDVPDGQHRFEVRAINADGVVSEQAAAFTLHIQPPFWRSSWFRAVAAMVLMIGVVGIIQYVSERKTRKRMQQLEVQRKLQRERTRISRDLHDHVGAQLSSLISGLELIGLNARQQQHEAVSHYATTLDEEARHTMAQLRETIWTLHDGPLTLDAFASKTRTFLRQQARFYSCPPSSTVSVEGTVTLSPIQALNLFRIVQEAAHNTLKHAGARHFTVHLAACDGTLTLTLSDDGTFRGDPTCIRPHDGCSHGLANMRHRAEELGGHFAIHINDGTRIRIDAPLEAAV